MFSWASAKDREAPGSVKSSVLTLIGIAVVVLALVSLGLLALTRSFSGVDSVATAQTGSPNVQTDADSAPGPAGNRDVTGEGAPQPAAAVHSADDELNALRERRNTAKASQQSAVIQAYVRAEKQYPNDYRFPYERAKLAIKKSESNSHDEAFDALSVAAERAIRAGKSLEMLDRLEADETGDFHKLSHGHYEWKQIGEALRKQNTRLLIAKAQF
jgi:hypothetical protein